MRDMYERYSQANSVNVLYVYGSSRTKRKPWLEDHPVDITM